MGSQRRSTSQRRRSDDRSRRIFATILAVACLTLLIVAAMLEPSAEGHGTHTALGMPPCSWSISFDRPCPTCGMTTAFAHAADADLVAAATAQPFGAFLAVLTASVFWGAAHVALTGSAIGRYAGRAAKPSILWTVAGSALAAWAYKWFTWAGR